MKVVELAAQTLAVAPLSLRSKDGAIPKVGAGIALAARAERAVRIQITATPYMKQPTNL